MEEKAHTPVSAVSILVSLYKCENYIETFFHHCEKILHKEDYEFLLLHNDPSETELSIIRRHIEGKMYYKHILIPQREKLYSTWNRGIKLASSPYITIWNVDDVRFPDSISNQMKALDDHPEVAMVYGDIWISNRYGEKGEIVTNSLQWSEGRRKEFYRSYFMSCFQMWRKSAHSTVGYFDEQFWCAADFDFQVRVALHFPLLKIENPIGIYLEGLAHKISNNGRQQIENNIIYKRYGALEKVNLMLSLRESDYTIGKLSYLGEVRDLNEKKPFSFFHRTKGMLYAILLSPYYFVRDIKDRLKK